MFYNKFMSLCEAAGISPAQACIRSGLSRTAYHKWKDGGMPGGEALGRMALVFGVSADSLVGLPDAKEPTAGVSGDELDLTDEESDVIRAYRSASPEVRQALARALGIKELL